VILGKKKRRATLREKLSAKRTEGGSKREKKKENNNRKANIDQSLFPRRSEQGTEKGEFKTQEDLLGGKIQAVLVGGQKNSKE